MPNITINSTAVAIELRLRSKSDKELRDGWTDTIMDILEDLYGLETAVANELKEVLDENQS